jgi:hypothetical protein
MSSTSGGAAASVFLTREKENVCNKKSDTARPSTSQDGVHVQRPIQFSLNVVSKKAPAAAMMATVGLMQDKTTPATTHDKAVHRQDKTHDKAAAEPLKEPHRPTVSSSGSHVSSSSHHRTVAGHVKTRQDNTTQHNTTQQRKAQPNKTTQQAPFVGPMPRPVSSSSSAGAAGGGGGQPEKTQDKPTTSPSEAPEKTAPTPMVGPMPRPASSAAAVQLLRETTPSPPSQPAAFHPRPPLHPAPSSHGSKRKLEENGALSSSSPPSFSDKRQKTIVSSSSPAAPKKPLVCDK